MQVVLLNLFCICNHLCHEQAIMMVANGIVMYYNLQVFSNQGHFIRTFGQHGSEKGQFNISGSLYGGVAVTQHGNIVVSETDNHRLQILTEKGKHLRTISSHGTKPGCFNEPQGISCKDGHVYVCDWGNKRIQVVSETGELFVLGT